MAKKQLCVEVIHVCVLVGWREGGKNHPKKLQRAALKLQWWRSDFDVVGCRLKM